MPITTEVIAGVLSILLLVETATGQTMPVTFSCDVRLLAMRFALKLQPERGSAGLAEVAAGLAVHPNGSACVGPPPTPPGPPGPPPPGPAPAPRPHVPFGQCSPPMGGVTLVHGRAKPCQPRPCSNPWRTTATVTACEELCKSNSSCQYGTWHDAKQGAYANACVLEGDNRYSPRREAGHTAFSCNHSGTLNDVPERLGHSIAWPPPPPRRLNRQLGRSRGWHLGVPSLTRTSDANTLYVDAAKGDDNSGAGTLRNPFRSILAALARATSLSAPRTIMLRAGTHFVNETLVLGPALSGTTITSYEHEEVVVSGGARLENLAWEKQPPPRHDGPTRSTWAPPAVDVYSARLADSLSFRELFNASNARLVPARTPNGNAELSPEEAHYTLRAAASPGMRDFGPVSAIVTNQSCAGCTDRFKGQFSYYSVGVGGPASNFVPPVSYWAQPHPHGGGATPYGIPAGVVHQAGTRGHPDDGLNLANATGGLVFMMQTHGWGSWVFDIASVAESGPNTTIMFGAGGFQEARGGAFPGSFYLSHRRELLDSPGEWYLDEAAGVLYLGVVVGSGPPISELFAGGSVNQLFRLQGSQEQPVCDVRISAITLRHSAPTYMSNHSVGSGGDYAVHRGGCITMRGTVNCTVDHSLFDGVGGNAVVLDGFNRHAHVRANEMRNIGENGVVLVGETEWVDGTAGDQPRLSVIEGNLIHHLGLYNKQACAVFSAVACQNTIENNIMFHGPRALFNMNDGFGGDTIARHNLFFKAVLETHDHGPYNSWDRLPFLTTVKNGSKTVDAAYNHLEGNMFFSGSPFAIDTDDGSDLLNATDNVIVAQPLWKTDFSGHSKIFQRNVGLWGACGGAAVLWGSTTPAEVASSDTTNVFTNNQCVGDTLRKEKDHGGPLLTTCGSRAPADCVAGQCIPCSNGSCPLVAANLYYTNVTTPASVCPTDHMEAGSQLLPLPADGGLALAAQALGLL